jgi:hypothetical protein
MVDFVNRFSPAGSAAAQRHGDRTANVAALDD